MLKSLTRIRNELQYYSEMHLLVKQRKYMKKVIKLEDFIDDMYLRSHIPDGKSYKLIIQTDSKFSNLIDEFFQFKYYLVSFLCFFMCNHLKSLIILTIIT